MWLPGSPGVFYPSQLEERKELGNVRGLWGLELEAELPSAVGESMRIEEQMKPCGEKPQAERAEEDGLRGMAVPGGRVEAGTEASPLLRQDPRAESPALASPHL